jgi:hypothetical protein
VPHKGGIIKEDERKCEGYFVVVCLADIVLLFSSNIYTHTAGNNITLCIGNFLLEKLVDICLENSAPPFHPPTLRFHEEHNS